MKKTLLKSALMALAGIGLMAGSAIATPLVGGISLSGSSIDVDNDPTTTITNWGTATFIDFSDNIVEVDVISGDFIGLVSVDEKGKINDFQFDPVTNVTPLWTFTDVWFDLTGYNLIQRSATNITLHGTGTIYTANDLYDPTPGTWNFTANNAGLIQYDSQGAITYNSYTANWSSSGATAPVPEPATMLLFGTGLAGLAGIARRKKK